VEVPPDLLFVQIVNDERMSRTLAQARDVLLPKRIGGQVRVYDNGEVREEGK